MVRLKRFARDVIHWNRTASNIMSRHDEARIVSRHLAESLVPARAIATHGLERWIDFGSGAGFPAIPLILAGIGKSWVLVESRRSKALFLRKMIESLDLRVVEVVHVRLETLDPARGGFDGFTSRATEGLDLTLELAAARVRSGGRAFLWRSSTRSEAAGPSTSWRNEWTAGAVTSLPDSLAQVEEFVRS